MHTYYRIWYNNPIYVIYNNPIYVPISICTQMIEFVFVFCYLSHSLWDETKEKRFILACICLLHVINSCLPMITSIGCCGCWYHFCKDYNLATSYLFTVAVNHWWEMTKHKKSTNPHKIFKQNQITCAI